MEAFSDIVIGFAMAQAGFNLVMPQHASEVFTRPTGLIAILVTFTVVSSIWFLHNRLFADFFSRSPLLVFLNFAMLCFTVLLVYMLQVFLHFGASETDQWGAYGYLGCLILLYGTIALLYALSMRGRWKDLSVEKRGKGVLTSLRLGGVSAGTAIGWGLVSASHWPIVYVALFAPAGALVGRLIFRAVKPRLAE